MKNILLLASFLVGAFLTAPIFAQDDPDPCKHPGDASSHVHLVCVLDGVGTCAECLEICANACTEFAIRCGGYTPSQEAECNLYCETAFDILTEQGHCGETGPDDEARVSR